MNKQQYGEVIASLVSAERTLEAGINHAHTASDHRWESILRRLANELTAREAQARRERSIVVLAEQTTVMVEPCDDECPACNDNDHGACERDCHAAEDARAEAP